MGLAMMTKYDDPAFGDELRRLGAAFALRKPEARDQAERALGTRLTRSKALGWRAGALWLRLEEDRADRIGEKIDAVETEARAIHDLLERHAKTNPLQQDTGSTPETHIKARREDPIRALLRRGKLTEKHNEAAADIAVVYFAVVAALMPRIGRMEAAGRSRRGFSGADSQIPAEIADRHAHVYKPWTEDVHRRRDLSLPFVIDIVIEGHALDTAAKAYRMSYKTGLGKLRVALDLYGVKLGQFSSRRGRINGHV